MRLSTLFSKNSRASRILPNRGGDGDLVKLSGPPSSAASGRLGQKQRPAVVVMTAWLAWLLWV